MFIWVVLGSKSSTLRQTFNTHKNTICMDFAYVTLICMDFAYVTLICMDFAYMTLTICMDFAYVTLTMHAH